MCTNRLIYISPLNSPVPITMSDRVRTQIADKWQISEWISSVSQTCTRFLEFQSKSFRSMNSAEANTSKQLKTFLQRNYCGICENTQLADTRPTTTHQWHTTISDSYSFLWDGWFGNSANLNWAWLSGSFGFTWTVSYV